MPRYDDKIALHHMMDHTREAMDMIAEKHRQISDKIECSNLHWPGSWKSSARPLAG
jgi:hypothetical protein